MRRRAAAQLASLALAAALFTHPAHASNMPKGKELRGFLNDTCIVSDEPYYLPPGDDEEIARGFPLANPIVGKVALAMLDGIIKLASSGLSDAASQKDMHYVSAYDIDMYRATLVESPEYALNEQLGCITVVAASFEPATSDCTDRYVPKQVPSGARLDEDIDGNVVRDDRSVENILRRANVCVEGKAHSVFEARVQYSDDRTAFQVEGAGLWVNALLSSRSRSARRSVVYLFDISEPGDGNKPRTLATAAIPIGAIKAGTKLEGEGQLGRSNWVPVPPISSRAATAYERDTALYQDLYAEIQSLEQSASRNRGLFEAMESRLSQASENTRQMMLTEMGKLEYKFLHMESLLDVRRREYEELPKPDRYYMPVTIGVGLIESKSENRALATLAAFLEEHRVEIVQMAEDSMEFERSIDAVDSADETTNLETARQAYYDALVAVEEARMSDDTDVAAAENQLARAKQAYNETRSRAGIPAVD